MNLELLDKLLLNNRKKEFGNQIKNYNKINKNSIQIHR
jgi:hypothetical protein